MEIKEGTNRFILLDQDKEIGEITYFFNQKQDMVVDHTKVDQAYRGQGLAVLLVEQVLAKARSKGLKIIPTCPYVLKYFQTHREVEDVWNQDPHDYEVACRL